MKKVKIIIGVLVVLILLAIPLYGYSFKDRHDINSEVKQLLTNKNSKQLKGVSENTPTYQFLTNTKYKKLTSVSDAQGEISHNTIYYAGRIGSTFVAFKVHKDTSNLFRKYFPKYDIVKMSINYNPF